MPKTKFYHIVLVTKYRKPVLVGETKEQLINILEDLICNLLNCELITMRVDNADHIHIMLKARPTQSVSHMMQILKQFSQYRIWCTDSCVWLREHYRYKNYLWSGSYFCSNTGEASIETIEKYINSQR